MFSQLQRRAFAETIALEDGDAVAAHNARAAAPHRIRVELGALPFDGDVMHAPLVLLVGSPACDMSATRSNRGSLRRGWPLFGLCPDAPSGLRALWGARLASLIDAFGAQHVANSVAALPLTPWACDEHDERLRLPSRTRMLELANVAARRGAFLLVTGCEELWTEAPDVATLDCLLRLHPKSFRPTHVSVENVGATAWHAICRRIESHHWKRLTA